MNTREIHISASSRPGLGAENRATDGSSFELSLTNAIRIPQRAKNMKLSVEKATIWWSTPNVDTSNNRVTIIDRRGRDSAGKVIIPEIPVATGWRIYEIVLLKGLYSVKMLNTVIDDQIKSTTGEDESLIEFSGNTSTDRVQFKTRQPFITVDMSVSNSIALFLGFEPRVYTATNKGTLFVAPGRATLSPTDFYLLQCSLVDDGIRITNRQSQIVAQVPITVGVGHQILYEPLRPSLMACENLRGQPVRTMRFALLKDDLSPADTNDNEWSIYIKIQYTMPMDR